MSSISRSTVGTVQREYTADRPFLHTKAKKVRYDTTIDSTQSLSHTHVCILYVLGLHVVLKSYGCTTTVQYSIVLHNTVRMPSFDSPPHFILPLFHPDYVVLGDPEARTHVGIHFSPSFLTLSANCHGSLSHVSQSEIATVTCGGHFVLSVEGCSLEGAVAMYEGDELEDHIQHTSLQVKVCLCVCVCVCVCICVSCVSSEAQTVNQNT